MHSIPSVAAAALGIVTMPVYGVEGGAGAAATFAKGAKNPGSQAKFLESVTSCHYGGDKRELELG